MPLATTTLANLQTARDNLSQVIAAQTAAWVSAGCPPTYSIDGESWNWDEWLQNKTKEINALTETIRVLSSPFVVRSRGRV